MKKLTFGMLILNIVFFIAISLYPKMMVSSKADDNIEERAPFLNIMTTNKSTYLMVKELVKDKHNVEFLLKNEEETKNFTFDKNVTDNISKMDLFIYSGAGFEPWANDLIEDLKKDKVAVVDVSRGTKIALGENEKQNPYYWMDFENYKIALFNVKNELETYDPLNKNFYEESYNDVVKNFEEEYLDKRAVLKNLENTEIYYVDSSLEYFSKYVNTDAKFLNKENLDKLISSKGNNKKQVIYYNDEKSIETYRTSIEEKQILLIKIDNYNESSKFIDVLSTAIDNVFTKLNLTLEDNKD